jgi:hypothetical protein
MRNVCALAILAMFWLATSPETVSAQRPGRSGRYYGGYGGYGGYGDDAGVMGLYTSAMSQSSMRSAAQSDRLAGQNAAMQQRAAVQMGARNMLSSQADARTQNILSQQQSNRDWWFQTQQQQTAGRQPSDNGSPALVSAGFGAEPVTGGFVVPAPVPEVAMDIIAWPSVLQEDMFASRRALIEAPYRRSPPDLSAPTGNDYRDMVKTVDEMKAMLEWRLSVKSGLPTNSYEQAKAFLDNLGKEASERAISAAKSPARA